MGVGDIAPTTSIKKSFWFAPGVLSGFSSEKEALVLKAEIFGQAAGGCASGSAGVG
jgi:hypothetical protein